jgi:sugar phosphate permease
MNGIAGLKSWQWLFLLPGLLIIPLGIMTYFVLANIPETVQCKSN